MNSLLVYAKDMRKAMTPAEKNLWYFLRKRQLHGFKFRRQVIIGKYIVDFLCYELRLIIEIDGGQHAENKRYDDLRTDWLKIQGFMVKRYWNNEVLNFIHTVAEDILNTCTLIFHKHPHPVLPPQGGKGPMISA